MVKDLDVQYGGTYLVQTLESACTFLPRGDYSVLSISIPSFTFVWFLPCNFIAINVISFKPQKV